MVDGRGTLGGHDSHNTVIDMRLAKAARCGGIGETSGGGA